MTGRGLEQLSLGLIGLGRWGRNYVRTIAGLPSCKLVAAATRNPEAQEILPLGCRVRDDWEELLVDPSIAGVIVAAPPALHAEITLAAIKHRKAVLVEKPLAISTWESEQIREALVHLPTLVMVDYIHLFHPAFRMLRQLVAQHGPILGLRSAAGNFGPYRRDVSVLWDWAPHDVAMALALVPGIAHAVRVSRLLSGVAGGGVGEELDIDLELAGGIAHRMALSTLKERHRWFAVEFLGGEYVYQDEGEHLLTKVHRICGSGARVEHISIKYIPPLSCAVLEFASAIQRGETSSESLELGLASTEVLAEAEAMLMMQNRGP